MKIMTKKTVSSIIALIMLFAAVFSNTVFVSADTGASDSEAAAYVVSLYGEIPEGITENQDGSYTVSEDVSSFNVALSIEHSSDIEAITGYLNYDSSLAVAKASVSGSVIVSEEAVSEAIALVPSSTNPDFADLNADGTKTAAELGRLVIAGYSYNENSAAFTSSSTSDDIAVIEFERATDADGKITSGNLTISFENIQTSNEDNENLDCTSNNLTLVLKGAEADSEASEDNMHLLGKTSHSGETDKINISDVEQALSYSRNKDNIPRDTYNTEFDIADVDGNGDISALDAAYILKKVNNSEYMFSSIENGRTDIIVKDSGEYIKVSSDYECGCEETTK